MKKIWLGHTGALAASLFVLQPGLSSAGEPLRLSLEQLDGITAGVYITANANAAGTGTKIVANTLTKTYLIDANGKTRVAGIALAITMCDVANCAKSSASVTSDAANQTPHSRVMTTPDGKVQIAFARVSGSNP